MPNPPWSDLGRLESAVQDVERAVRGKANSDELDTIRRRLGEVERAVEQLRADMVEVVRQCRD